MISILQNLFGRKSNNDIIEAPELSIDTLCKVSKRLHLTDSSQLMVGAGQVAALFSGEQRTRLYPTGVHDLSLREKDFVHQYSQAQALYIQIAPPTVREWSISLTSNEKTNIALTGHYSVAVENAKKLCDHLLMLDTESLTSAVDDWIGNILKEVMQSQHISSDDITQYRERLQKFLIDAINPILWDRGLALSELIIQTATTNDNTSDYQLSLNRSFVALDDVDKVRHAVHADTGADSTDDAPNTNSASPSQRTDNEQTASAATISDFQQSLLEHSNTSDSATNNAASAKIYYRIVNGQQDGPYNIEQMQLLIDEDTLKPTDLIWTVGLPSWQRADSIKQLHWSPQ